MRPASLFLFTVITVLPVFFFPAAAETQVFQDAVFPYRISCKTEWTQEVKNDTTFQLRTTLTGKKTRFQLKKYTLDTNDTRELMRWSRINFAVNREIAGKLGTVLFSDTGINKKIGDLRAFELCALYLQTSGEKDSVWWGELSRWTEYRGYGYYIAVISDTADLIVNRAIYKTMLDSVSISGGIAALVQSNSGNTRFFISVAVPRTGMVNDLLGRKLTRSGPGVAQLLMQQSRKRLVVLRPGG